MKKSIYQYKTASRYLLDCVVEKQKHERGFSIRKWAKEMEFQSHSLLAMILQGKRSITLRQVANLARGLALSTPEKMFFQGLVQVENAKTKEERDWCELWLSELRPISENSGSVREIDEYLSIADWIHPALLALSDTQNSFRDASEAAEKLGQRNEVIETRSAIERLVDLGLLKKDANHLYRATCKRMTTKDDIANKGAREYHKQCAALTARKIEEQSILEREFQSLAMAIPGNKIPLAKELIRKFRTQFSQAMASEYSDQVYQLNLHFFRLTENPSELNTLKESEGADRSLKINHGVNHEISI